MTFSTLFFIVICFRYGSELLVTYNVKCPVDQTAYFYLAYSNLEPANCDSK